MASTSGVQHPAPKVNTTARGAGQQDAMDRSYISLPGLSAQSSYSVGSDIRTELSTLLKGMSSLAASFMRSKF